MRSWVRGLSDWLYRRYHATTMKRAISGKLGGLDDIETFLRTNAIPLSAPLVLISQVQRSGGTLLSQLFDAHPALAAYPHELKFGFPQPDVWPRLDPAEGAEHNFQRLFDRNFAPMIARGFAKGDRTPERHGFALVPRLQYRLFKHLCETAPLANARAVLDRYFTAFFNAWLNYQGDLRHKQAITAFAPRLANAETNVDGFFADYPDGKLIQIVRDPKSWYPSARGQVQSGFADKAPEYVLNRWCISAEAMLRNGTRHGDRVITVRFEDLVGYTEATMRQLSAVLGLCYDPVLCEPSFNGRPMRANSSFEVGAQGVIAAPLARQGMLSAAELRLIEDRCASLYERVLAGTMLVRQRSELNAATG